MKYPTRTRGWACLELVDEALVAPNKRKILEAARKFVQKGAKEKALKEYGRLLKLDPRDAKLRLEIGDAHRRWGQVDEAIAAYTKVAEQYMGEGFDARAIAVFKQIQGLDPERWASYVPLAELYQRMGLNSEAVQALQVAADGLHKDGEKREALELLRRMATLDPTNTASRIKVADLLGQEGMNDEAVAEYDAAYAELDRQGEQEEAAKVLERILEVVPDRIASLVALGRNLVGRDLAQHAEPFVKRAIEIEADETAHYELLADVYRATNRDEELTATYRTLADVYRQRGDEDQARSITQRFVPLDELAPSLDSAADSFGTSGELLDDTLLEDEELLEEEELLEQIVDDGATPAAPVAPPTEVEKPVLAPELELDGESEIDASANAVVPAPAADKPSLELDAEDEPAPVGDPDQLLAEASVYLRYGKRAKAIRNLSAVLDANPQHRVALEKLGEAHADGGDGPKAVAAWVRAAELAHDSGDQAAVAVLRDRVEALDPEAVSRIPVVEAAADAALDEMLVDAAPGAGEATPEADDSIEFEFDESEVAEVAPPQPDAGIEIDALEIDEDIEIDDSDLDDPLSVSLGDSDPLIEDSDLETVDAADLPIDPAATAGEASPGETLPQIDVDFEAEGSDAEDSLEDLATAADSSADFDADADADLGGEESISLSEAAAEASQSALGVSASLSVTSKVNDDLEEAEFYHQQGLLEEARGIYERVLEMAPNHPLALVRMGEIEAAGAGGATAAAAPEVASDAAENSSEDFRFGEDDLDASQPSLVETETETESEAGPLEIAASEDASQAEEEFAFGDEDEAADASIAEAAASSSLAPDSADAASDLAFDDDDEASELPLDVADQAAESPLEAADAASELALDAADDPSDLALDADAEPSDLGVAASNESSDVMLGAADEDEVAGDVGADDLFAGDSATGALDDPAVSDATAAELSLDAEAESLVGADAPDADPAGASYDLAAELSGFFDDASESASASSTSGAAGAEADVFSAVFSEFKKGVSEQLEDGGDHETRYDLGIAYREMGLLEDAVGEFELAAEGGTRQLECLHLLGLCTLDLGRGEEACTHLQTALDSVDPTAEEATALRFDLGRAFEAVGRISEAREAWEAVAAVDPSFGEVEERLATLGEAKPEVAADDMESFEEFFQDEDEDSAVAETTAETAPVVEHESFEDLIAEANADTDASPQAEPEAAAAEPEPDPAAEAEPKPTRKKRRKKKISFV